MVDHVSLMVFGLYEMGWWELKYLKSTLFWTFSIAIVTLFRSQNAIDDPYYFSIAIKDNLKLIIILEFILTLYSFNIWVELVTVPLLTILVMVNVFSQSKKEYAVVVKTTEVMFLVYFIILLIYTIYNIYSGFTEFTNTDTLFELILPPLLSILFLPFMYLIVIYLSYERAFMRINLSLSKDLMGYAKLWSMINFHADRVLLSRWSTIVSYTDINTKKQLLESIHKAKKMKLAEERCDEVKFEDGWSPHSAKHYLTSLGITTNYYHPLYDELWHSNSNYLTLEDEMAVLSNTIAYYIEGDEKHAKLLKLILNVNNSETSSDAKKVFVGTCKTLAFKALNVELPEAFSKSIIRSENFEKIIKGRMVSIEIHNWVGRAKGCYELKFIIAMTDFNVVI